MELFRGNGNCMEIPNSDFLQKKKEKKKIFLALTNTKVVIKRALLNPKCEPRVATPPPN